MAIVVALTCSMFAIFWALRQLRLVGTSLHFDPSMVARAMRRDGVGATKRMDAAMGTEREIWESELVKKIVNARSADEAQSEVSVALWEVDGRLTPATCVYAACARIAVFGCLIGVALLFMDGQGLTMKVVDVFAIGASGMLVTVTSAKEARRLAKRKREAVDKWIEVLLRSRWPSVVWDQE